MPSLGDEFKSAKENDRLSPDWATRRYYNLVGSAARRIEVKASPGYQITNPVQYSIEAVDPARWHRFEVARDRILGSDSATITDKILDWIDIYIKIGVEISIGGRHRWLLIGPSQDGKREVTEAPEIAGNSRRGCQGYRANGPRSARLSDSSR
jgi:hypothetical protein